MQTQLEVSQSAPPGKSRSRTNESGFTLVEVLVATFIMTVGLVALAELMGITLRMQMLGRNQTSAIRLAQDKLDELMALNFDTEARIQIGGSLATNTVNYFDTATSEYTRRWVVTAGPDGSADLRQITVRVIPTLTDTRTTATFELTSIIRRW